MVVELRSVGVSPGADSTSCVIAKPVGLSVSWLMIAQVISSKNGVYPSPTSAPANWTQIRQDGGTDPDDELRSALFWKIADGDDVAASNFTFTTDDMCNMGAISAWTGHDPTTPINANNGQWNSYGNTATSPAITPSVANCMVCMFCGHNRASTFSGYAIVTDNPASWSEAYDISTTAGNDCALALGYALRPETSSTGLGTASASASERTTGQLVAIAPAAPPEEEISYIPHCGPKKKRTQWLGTMRT